MPFLKEKEKNYTSEILNTANLTPFYDNTVSINLVFSTCQHKYKWILCTEDPVLSTSIQYFWCTTINNHLICFEKSDAKIDN